ncbi:hypothetical protein JYU34_004635 [Plutella xylostella]|uniref:Uncharacterized protein n=1 Tax=Plutella xylostella TaxID=51655 RepID=A0ABQ7QYG9_PLUXY|nr:hypothetical protein JYU34_004635 [Plutella xylostella]
MGCNFSCRPCCCCCIPCCCCDCCDKDPPAATVVHVHNPSPAPPVYQPPVQHQPSYRSPTMGLCCSMCDESNEVQVAEMPQFSPGGWGGGGVNVVDSVQVDRSSSSSSAVS